MNMRFILTSSFIEANKIEQAWTSYRSGAAKAPHVLKRTRVQ